MSNLARALAAKGDWKSAEELNRRAIEILLHNFPEKSWRVATTKLLLGESLKGQKRYAEAEPLMLEAYPIIKESFGADHPRTQAAVKGLAGLYEAWGKQDQAAQYRGLLKADEKK